MIILFKKNIGINSHKSKIRCHQAKSFEVNLKKKTLTSMIFSMTQMYSKWLGVLAIALCVLQCRLEPVKEEAKKTPKFIKFAISSVRTQTTLQTITTNAIITCFSSDAALTDMCMGRGRRSLVSLDKKFMSDDIQK